MTDLVGDRVRPALPIRPQPDRRKGTPMGVLPDLIALAAGLLVLVPSDPKTGLRLLVWVSCGYAIYMVATKGGAYLSPSGIYFLSSGVFIGLAAHYLLLNGSVNSFATLRDLSAVAFLSTVTTAMVLRALSLRWRLRWPSRAEVRRVGAAQRQGSPPPQFQLKAILMIAVSQVPQFKSAVGAVSVGLGVAGVMMLVLSGSARRVRLRWHGEIAAVLVAVVVPLLWLRFEFRGAGRLAVAGLAVGALLLWNFARPRTVQKLAVILAIPVFLLYSGLIRANDSASSNGVVKNGEGLESVYSPLDTWAELTQKKSDTPGWSTGPLWGRTFYDTAVLPVPRSIWPNKPAGFGSKLNYMLRLQEVRNGGMSTDNSLAALSQGEWYVDFGYPGLVLMSVAIGWFLAVLDRAHLRLVRTGLSDPSTWWRAVIVACLSASLGDLFWVGTFTVYARGGLAAITAWIVWRLSTSPNRWGRYSRSAKVGSGDQNPVEESAAVSDP